MIGCLITSTRQFLHGLGLSLRFVDRRSELTHHLLDEPRDPDIRSVPYPLVPPLTLDSRLPLPFLF